MSIFKNFYNKASKNNRIFTREDIKKMSTKEFIKNEKAIDYQMMNLGLPTNQELAKSTGAIYVHEYMRSDGTVVRAHYRSKQETIISAATALKTPMTTEEAIINYASRAAKPFFPLADANLQNAMRDFAHANNDKNAHIINSRSEVHNKELNNLMDKIGIPKESKGVLYDSNSKFSKQLWKSNEIRSFVKHNAGELFSSKVDSVDIEFIRKNNFDNFAGIQHCKLYKPHITKDGYFNGFIVDYYDFDYRNYNGIADYINNWGYSMQEKKQLENYFIIYHIHERI